MSVAGAVSVRQNFNQECEAGINKQINLELYSSYVYMSMAYYYDRDDVALPGCFKYFSKQSDEEREHARKLLKYQNDRGGRVVLQDIKKPIKDEWGSPLEALNAAFELEKQVNQSLLDLHDLAAKHNDPHLSDFLEDHYLKEQVDSIKEIGDFIAQLKRCGTGLGEYLFDKETLGELAEKD